MAVRAVVVGTGFGGRVHVPALRNAGFDVAAMVGRDAEKTARRAQRLGVPQACTSLAEALAIPGVEVVSIATPPAEHAALAIEAVEAGRHVICEKPFAIDAVEARRMRDAAAKAGVVALVGHEFRFAEDRATARDALASGAVGEVRLVSHVSFTPLLADPAAPTPPWWFDPARGGGWLGASGSHVVDQVRSWLGEFDEVSAGLSVVSDRKGVADDTFTLRFSLKSGAQGVLHQSAGAWGPAVNVTRVSGPAGSLWLEDGEVWLATADGHRRLEVPEALRLPAPPEESDDPRHRFTHIELSPFTRLCEVLGDLMAGRPPRHPAPPATFQDGYAGMLVLDAARASAMAGGESVRVPAPDGP
ncbi:MAG TPA: Gfo/Idh/MocA family oxidoreductase [Acidimicrobiales bacterium]|nr:Gfo/Idh/MocA family oxidoreductase [Acidimicrobiales bacterium]